MAPRRGVRRAPEYTTEILVKPAVGKPTETFILKYGASLSLQHGVKMRILTSV